MKVSHTLLKSLQQAGLHHKAALMYAAALALGSGTISELAHAAGLERTGLYYHLDDLVGRGYLKTSRRGQRTLYHPANPELIQRQLAAQEQAFSSILPNLTTQYAATSATSAVTYFEGVDGLIHLYQELEAELKELGEDAIFRVVARSFEAVETLPDFIPRYMERRARMKLRTHIIQPASERPPQNVLKSRDPKVRAKYNLHAPNQRYLPDRYLKGSEMGAVLILNDRVAMIDFKNQFASLTVNQQLTRTWQVLFDFMWDHLPK